MSGYHAAVHMNSASVAVAADSDTLLVSCVDKAQPAAHPQITLPQGPYKARVGESIDLVMTVVDRDTQNRCLTVIWSCLSTRRQTAKGASGRVG